MHPGLIVRALRVTSGGSQTAVAAAAGISQPYLSNIEAGVRGIPPRLEEPLARALGAHPDVVAGRAPVLAALRVRRGVDRHQLAAAAGIPVAQLARFEAGAERPTAVVAELLAARLGVDPAVLGPLPLPV